MLTALAIKIELQVEHYLLRMKSMILKWKKGWWFFHFMAQSQQREARLVSKVHFKPVFHPANKIRQLLCPVKRLCGPKSSRHLPCICCTESLTENSRYIRLRQPEKSGLAEHCISLGHQSQERPYQELIISGIMWF